jgi:hypothetical protein
MLAGGRVVQLGACEEDQTAVTSKKLPGVGTYTGAATYAFVTAIKQHGQHQSYSSLLQHMTETLCALGKVSDKGLPEVLAEEAAAAAADAAAAAEAAAANVSRSASAKGIDVFDGSAFNAAAAADMPAQQQQPAGTERTVGLPSAACTCSETAETASKEAAAAAAAAAAAGNDVESRFAARGPLHDLLGLLTGLEATQDAGELARTADSQCGRTTGAC